MRRLATEPYTLRDHLTAQARRFESRIFLEYGDAQYSYRSIDDVTDRVATALSRLGLRRGERVALVLSDRPEFVFFLWGAPKVGLVPAPIDPSLPPGEIASLVERAEPAALVTEQSLAGSCLERARRSASLRHTLVIDAGDAAAGFDPLAGGPVLDFWPDLDPGDAAALVFTRGTGGRRKAVLLSHTNLIANSSQLIQPLRINSTDRFYRALPLASPSGLVLELLTPWSAGACAVLHSGRASCSLPALLAERRITVLTGTPALFEDLARSDEVDSRNLSALRLGACVPGPVSAAVLERFEERYDALIVEGYGLTEATCVSCVNPYTGVRKPGSLGLPLPGQQCRLALGSEREPEAGQVGEIVLRGPTVMLGYFDDPAGTRAALRDGWLHTGDYGYADSDGYYHLTPSSAARPA